MPTVVITGASMGIGRALALQWAARGSTVVLSARGRAALDDVAREVEAAGGRAIVEAGDVTDEAHRVRLVARAELEGGGLDVLVNNAGRGFYAPALKIDIDEMRKLFELNVVAPDEHSDPSKHLDEELGFGGAESAMQPLFSSPQSSSRGAVEPVTLYQRARELIDEGEPGEAIPLLEKAIKVDMNFARAVHALGKAYASVGDYHRARRAFRHLVKLEANDPEAHVLYAAAAVQCDRMDEARDALSKAIKIDPEFTPAYRYAAQLYERLGDEEKARKFRARYQALKLRG